MLRMIKELDKLVLHLFIRFHNRIGLHHYRVNNDLSLVIIFKEEGFEFLTKATKVNFL